MHIPNGVLHIAAYCSQGCYNGGICTSPYTCTCTAGWIGGDCNTGQCIHTYIHYYILGDVTLVTKIIRYTIAV